MQIFKTKKKQEPAITEKIEVISEDSWIRLYEPSETEIATVAEKCAIPPEFLKKQPLMKRNGPALMQKMMSS